MPTIRIPPGVVRGESRASVPGRWFDTNLIRWQQGVMRPVGGWERILQTPLGSIPRVAHVWKDNNDIKHSAYVCDQAVWRETGGSYSLITPADMADANSNAARGFGSGAYGILDFGMDDEERGASNSGFDPKRYIRFCADHWGEDLLFSSSADGRIFVWKPSLPNAVPLVALNAPTLVQAFLVTDERHLMTFASAGFPNRVAWSGQEDRTDWNYTNVAGSAGFQDLEGAGGIITAVKIPGAVLVFTLNSVWIGRYVGAPYYYGFTRVAEGAVPISAHAIATAGAQAFWMGQRSFWRYQGGVVAPLPTSLGLDPFEDMDEVAPRRVTAGFNGAYPEIWFFYPEKQDIAPAFTENNRYIIYNFDENWWSPGYMGRSFYQSSPLDGVPLAGDEQTYLFQHERGYLAEGQPRGDMVYAEVGSISFDDGEHNWTVNQAQVDSSLGAQSVKFHFKGRRARGGPEADFGLKTPRPNGFLDTHFTAKDFSMRVIGNADGPWSLGAMVFHDVKKRGKV